MRERLLVQSIVLLLVQCLTWWGTVNAFVGTPPSSLQRRQQQHQQHPHNTATLTPPSSLAVLRDDFPLITVLTEQLQDINVDQEERDGWNWPKPLSLLSIHKEFPIGVQQSDSGTTTDNESSISLPDVQFIAETDLPTALGSFRMRAYRVTDNPVLEPCVIYASDKPCFPDSGDDTTDAAIPMRIHDQCITSEVFGSLRYECIFFQTSKPKTAFCSVVQNEWLDCLTQNFFTALYLTVAIVPNNYKCHSNIYNNMEGVSYTYNKKDEESVWRIKLQHTRYKILDLIRSMPIYI
jgi:hypothetical protein